MTRKSIFIADAEQQTVSLVASILEARGYAVSRFQNGKAVVDAFKKSAPDLIVVGEQLDDIDGIGLIVKLRSVSRTTKVVLVSNEWREASLYQMLTKDYGVGLVVHRPIKTVLFGAQIDSLLNAPKIDMNSAKEHERQALIALRLRFREALPARLAVLNEAVLNGTEQPGDKVITDEATRLAHNLKGTARTCGFEALADAAMALEKYLASLKPLTEVGVDAWSEAEGLFGTVRTKAEEELARNSDEVASTGQEESAMAKVLFVGNGGPATTDEAALSSGGLGVKMINTNAADAIPMASQTALDAVLIDLATANGEHAPVKLAREIRGLAGNESLPLGFIKARTETLDRIETTHAGASLFLDSPVETEALREGIEYLLAVRQGGRPRVLVVDDDPDFASLIVTTLGKEGMLVRTVQDPTGVLQAMDEFIPDLVLLDVLMPVMSGFEVCRLLRTNSRWQDTPILFLTAETELDARLAAFDAGGDDYLPKPVAAVELLTRVRVRLERARLIRERADKDALTGLLLRRAFMEQIAALISEASRHEMVFTVALIDVDKFKLVNDTFGHLAGDRVLTRLGQLLKKRFRVEDIRGRWGGEEFIVALRHEKKETTQGAFARLLDELQHMQFEGDHGEVFTVTFTAGLSSFPEDGDTLEQLVRAADSRLYLGKEAGRNRVVVSD